MHSTFEEYGHNSTHLRDRLLLASARLLAGWPKMPGERECHARFLTEWGPRNGPQAPNVRSAPAKPWRSSTVGAGTEEE